jgi:glucokinase
MGQSLRSEQRAFGVAQLLVQPSAVRPTSLAAERDARFVFEACGQGDSQARAALDTVFTMLGVGIANIVAVIDPDLIVLGGGVVKGAPNLLLQTTQNVTHTILRGLEPPIKLSSLEDKAQTYGAICAALSGAQRAALRKIVY